MQAILPADKKWLNGMFLEALKKAVADGNLIQAEDAYRISANNKKDAKAASKPKNVAVLKKKATHKEKADLKKKTASKNKAVSS